MKRHIELNSLRATAAAFLLVQGANAGKVYCANAEEKVVAESNCDGTAPPGTFYMFNSEEELGIGSKVSLKNAEVYDSNEAFEKRHELFPADEPMQDLEDNGYIISIDGEGRPTWIDITVNTTDSAPAAIPKRDAASNNFRANKRYNWPSGTYPWCPVGYWFLENDFYQHGWDAVRKHAGFRD
ncbi:hypothetical protein CGCF415_v007840 [Colletotrichum fructicola]|nr:hypothetical protein CGCF415_v007840 [Colletotrichum fructicola]KAF4924697.1 hypothetical protein CGCF245_v014416 [Colletotrichum fructicola]